MTLCLHALILWVAFFTPRFLFLLSILSPMYTHTHTHTYSNPKAHTHALLVFDPFSSETVLCYGCTKAFSVIALVERLNPRTSPQTKRINS